MATDSQHEDDEPTPPSGDTGSGGASGDASGGDSGDGGWGAKPTGGVGGHGQGGQASSDTGGTARPDPGVEAMLEVMRRLEMDLEQLRLELAWSQRLATLGSLAAVVAHEVNNTLTPVTSYAQLALESPDDEALTRKALESAVDGVARATRIAASVLGMVQDSPAGGGEACCLLRDTVDDALACLARDPARDGITVTVDLPDVAVSIARGDLQQVLVNLFLNARKALLQSSGARRLTLSGQLVAAGEATTSSGEDAETRSPRDGSFVELVVADSGPGIPEAMRGRLFEAFSTSPIQGPGGAAEHAQAPPHGDASGDAARERGTGLGLSICRDLMQRAGGAISADAPRPTGGRGAVFRLRLPVAA